MSLENLVLSWTTPTAKQELQMFRLQGTLHITTLEDIFITSEILGIFSIHRKYQGYFQYFGYCQKKNTTMWTPCFSNSHAIVPEVPVKLKRYQSTKITSVVICFGFFFECRFCFSFSLECTYFRPALYLSKIHSIFHITSDVTNEIINNGAHSGKNEKIRGVRDENIEFSRCFSRGKRN